MKRALLLYWHGLGDVIQLTPHLRYLYKRGYKTDLMCRKEIRESKLLDACPYVDKLIEVLNPWRSSSGAQSKEEFHRTALLNFESFQRMQDDYDWSGKSPHNKESPGAFKIDKISYELDVVLEDKRLEVFIPETAEEEALKYMDSEYIFVHTVPQFHWGHNWDANEWMEKHLPHLKVIDTGYGAEFFEAFDDINTAFVLMREAKYRVLSSSVFVHACDAMDLVIDAVNYGWQAREVWPLDQSKVLHIREKGMWIK